ncbi:MAG: 2-oxo acid dehydrogenase subunit E2 [Holosporaceae bacterium]
MSAKKITVSVPPLGESISNATLARWLKNEGDNVAADDLLAELETDKITLEVTAPSAAVLQKQHAKEGATVDVGALLATLEPLKEGAAPPKEKPKATAPAAETKPADKLSHGGAPSSLRAPKEALLDQLLGAPTPASKASVPLNEVEERKPMSRLRMKIAQQLKAAQNTAAILTTFNEVDMTQVMALRKQHKTSFEATHGVKLGFMSFFVKAVVSGLKRFPIINAQLLDHTPDDPTAGKEVVFKNYYHIGVAVGTEKGLVVPTLRHAQQLSFAGIEQGIADLAVKARTQKLVPKDLADGTFTITNGGVYGSLLSTPLLNPPQSAILGLHAIQQRPVVVDGAILARPVMNLALSYDHRLIDGKDAVGFLKHVKEVIAMPASLLLEGDAL